MSLVRMQRFEADSFGGCAAAFIDSHGGLI